MDSQAKKIAAQRTPEFWWGCQSLCESILKDLLKGEFSEIKDTVHIALVFVEIKASADVEWDWIFKNLGHCIIRVRAMNWLEHKDFYTSGALELVLRHELLHILTRLSDGDSKFEEEARRRGIDSDSLFNIFKKGE